MDSRWFSRANWPLPHEGQLRQALMAAIASIPRREPLTDDDIERKALTLLSASCWGRSEELPRNREASHKASESDLRELAGLCRKLERHIEGMRRPAVDGLYANGFAALDLLAPLREAQEAARCAFSDLDPGAVAIGRRRKIEAEQVTIAAADVFEKVAVARPTFTVDPLSSKISGAWPEFLAAIFSAFGIDASVESQVRRLMEERRNEGRP